MAHTLTQPEFAALNKGSVSRLSSAKIAPPLIAMGMALLAAWLLSMVISDGNNNPVAVLLLVSGILSVFYALMRPWNSLLLFVWLAMTIDGIKRLTYALSDMSFLDVASILLVPVLLMGGIYLRIIFLHWFAARHEITKVDLKKFWPILLLAVVASGAMLYKDRSLSNIAANYQFLCYIPAAVAVPHLLNSSLRWNKFSRSMIWIVLIVGIYGFVQAVHGPFDYELEYMRSGLTSTISLIEEEYFRAFSLLNTSATFAGTMMMCTFYGFYALCQRRGQLHLSWPVVGLGLFTTACCFASTQRGALSMGVLVLVSLPLFRRPQAMKGLLLVAVVLYVLLVWFAPEVKDYMYVLEEQLEPLRVNDFMRQNLHVLTFGQRLDGMIALQQPGAWTLFGGGDVGGGHNLMVDLLGWTGAVGLTIFIVLSASILNFSLGALHRLRHSPRVYLWAQINLAVFIYVLVWSMVLGSVIHVSPMNFFFWLSIGNLIFIANNPSKTFQAELTAEQDGAQGDLDDEVFGFEPRGSAFDLPAPARVPAGAMVEDVTIHRD